jgi:hypothetical protein
VAIQPGVYCSVIELFRPLYVIDLDGNETKLPEPGPLPNRITLYCGDVELDWDIMKLKMVNYKGEVEERSFTYEGSTLSFDYVKLA